MNASRQKKISKLIDRIEKLKGEFAEITSEVETVAADEREQYDNMSATRQESDVGVAADNAADELEEVHTALSELDLDDLISKLDNAKGEQ